MKTILAPRASSIIYNFLVSNNFDVPFAIPSNACPIVPLTFLKSKVAFELVDISNVDYCIDLNRVEDLIKAGKVGGLVFIYTYGINHDNIFENLLSLKSKYPHIIIIEDMCLCYPKIESKKSLFDLSVFSTGYGKSVDIGYGGFGFINDIYRYNRIELNYESEQLDLLENKYNVSLRNKTTFTYEDSDWLDNSILIFNAEEYFNKVKQELIVAKKQKESINKIFSSELPKDVILSYNDGYYISEWRFNVMVKEKEVLLKNIFNNKLFASSHYPPINHLFNQESSEHVNSRNLHAQVVNLFNYKYVDENYAYLISELVNKHIQEYQ